MGERAAETVVKTAVQNTHATVRKSPMPKRNRRPVFKAWTVSRLLEEYRDPRAILLEIASKDTAALAKEINCTLIEALGERRLCAMTVLPYVAQKLPMQVDMRHTRAVHLNIVDERTYTDLLDIAATPQTDDTMQLIAGAISEESSEADGQGTGDATPVTPQAAPTLPEEADQASDKAGS